MITRYTDIQTYLYSQYVCRRYEPVPSSWPSLCHLSPGSSMVRASHQRSEGYWFDFCLQGAQQKFSEFPIKLSMKLPSCKS